ncbi:MAG: hypothetical protein K0B02_04660 [DPANN group archaeon]|nr:hypothetical protein [DPANN group archaeon]
MTLRLSEELSYEQHRRRMEYFYYRKQLDLIILQFTLLDSYNNFKKAKCPYPFVDIKSLEHTFSYDDSIDVEYEHQNSALILFYEDKIDPKYERHFRFNSKNRVMQENFYPLLVVDNYNPEHQKMEHPEFENFFKKFLYVDSAILIQENEEKHYSMTNFHMRIDKSYYECTEQFAVFLRYVSRNLQELNPELKENMQAKIAQYYGFNYYRTSNRRQAAIVAASTINTDLDFIGTVYVSSSSERTLTKISEKGVSKYILLRLTPEEIEELNIIIGTNGNLNDYIIEMEQDSAIVILQVIYVPTTHSKPPEDDKLREFSAKNSWIKVEKQLIIPRLDKKNVAPIKIKKLYGCKIKADN